MKDIFASYNSNAVLFVIDAPVKPLKNKSSFNQHWFIRKQKHDYIQHVHFLTQIKHYIRTLYLENVILV